MRLADLSERDLLQSIWASLRRLEEKEVVSPTPMVVVDPPDLTEIVTAVTGLKPAATAEDIAYAIKDVLQPHSPLADDATDVLRQVANALENLDFRLKGVGTQAYGGGSVTFAPGQVDLLAEAINGSEAEPTVEAYTKAGYTTTAGANTIHTPAAGTRACVHWVGLSSSQENLGENLVIVRFGSGEAIYRWRMGNPGAFSHREDITGPVDTPLVLDLENANGIDWNITVNDV